MPGEPEKMRRLVDETFRRSVAGVFAVFYPNDEMYVNWKTGADWLETLGLASRVQQEAYANLTEGGDAIVKSTEAALKSNPPVTDDEDLSLVTFEAILAELYRCKVAWVLALRRHRKVEQNSYWEGVLWNGSGLTCMGLAAALQHTISESTAKILDDQLSGGQRPTLMDRTGQVVLRLNECQGDELKVAGIFAHMTYEAARLRKTGHGEGSSLQDFLDGTIKPRGEQR